MKIEDRVIDLIATIGIPRDDIKPESEFWEDLGCDSLDFVELLIEAEEEFGIDIPDEDAETLTTVGKAVEYIRKKITP